MPKSVIKTMTLEQQVYNYLLNRDDGIMSLISARHLAHTPSVLKWITCKFYWPSSNLQVKLIIKTSHTSS